MSEIDRLAWLMREKSEMTDCPLTHEMCVPLVRCVLEGLREPTEAMIQVARRSAPFDRDVTETWGPMIDELLRG